MNQIRCFIAVEVPVEVINYLIAESSKIEERIMPRAVRWTRPENIHVTLKFLGDTDTGKLDRIASDMDRLVAGTERFELTLDKLGCFPNSTHPRVIWAGLQGDLTRLGKLQRSLEYMLVPLGWKAEKREFSPHLTLGRVKNSREVVKANIPWGITFEPLRIAVSTIHLIESDLRPTGAVYTVRHISSLASQSSADAAPR